MVDCRLRRARRAGKIHLLTYARLALALADTGAGPMTQLRRKHARQAALLLRNAERILAQLPSDDRVATVLSEIGAALAIIDRTWEAAHA